MTMVTVLGAVILKILPLIFITTVGMDMVTDIGAVHITDGTAIIGDTLITIITVPIGE